MKYTKNSIQTNNNTMDIDKLLRYRRFILPVETLGMLSENLTGILSLLSRVYRTSVLHQTEFVAVLFDSVEALHEIDAQLRISCPAIFSTVSPTITFRYWKIVSINYNEILHFNYNYFFVFDNFFTDERHVNSCL